MKILDIHSHQIAPYTLTALSAVELAHTYSSAADVPLEAGHLYSIGIHPWDTMEAIDEATMAMLREMAQRSEVAAIGECGIDTLKGGPMFRQINTFKQHIQLSEQLSKPLIIHDVKAHDVIIGLHGDLRPAQPWVIHGFRYKPSVARMFTSRGIYLSFGLKYNTETVVATPRELLLAETDDDTDTDIESVISAISKTLNCDVEQQIATNSSRFLGLHNES